MRAKLKRGDIGPDGRVFLRYCKTCKNGEQWVSSEKLLEITRKAGESRRNHYRKYPSRNIERSKTWNKNNPKSHAKSVLKIYHKNPEIDIQRLRRAALKKTFAKTSGQSITAFLGGLRIPSRTLSAIIDIALKPGESLASVIQVLSGYEMSVCQEIADLCSPEIENESSGE